MTQNNLRVSVISGDDVILINGFQIMIYVNVDVIEYEVRRKGKSLGTYRVLQEAVKWCEE